MSRTSEATPSAGRDGDSHAAGSSSSEAPGIRAPVVAATPLDPALVDLIAAKVAAQLRGSAAENVPGAMAGEQPVRGPAPSAVSARGDSPERPDHREAGGKEGCSGSGVVGERSETRVPVVGHGHIDTVSVINLYVHI